MSLGEYLSDGNDESISTTFLKIRGKTLIYGNVIYQISNITTVGLVNLSTTKKLPQYFLWWILIGIGCLFFLPGVYKVMGIVILGVIWFLYNQFNQNRINEKYGMTIHTNHGHKVTLRSKNKDFVKKVIYALYNVMNSEELKAINFNFETLDYQAVNIEKNIGSPVIRGNITGDIVNHL